MPTIGRDRLAKPLAVWEAFRDTCAGVFIRRVPKPSKTETCNQYLQRLDWKEEAIFMAIIAAGCTTDGSQPNQRNFLWNLEAMSEILNRIRAELSRKWPK